MKTIGLLVKTVLCGSVLLCAFACGNNKSGQFPVFDTTAFYPAKDFDYSKVFDIKYIPIKTDSIFVGSVSMFYVSDHLYMGTVNRKEIVFINNDGEIFKKINKNGNSAEEYLSISDVFYDDKAQEIFIWDSQRNHILVLDGDGNFKRCFDIEKDRGIADIMNYDDDLFIIYSNDLALNKEYKYSSYSLLSKKDGKPLEDIFMSCQGEKRYPTVINLPKYISIYKMINMVPVSGGVLLSEAYCDTMYRCSGKDAILEPVMIKAPAFHTMDAKKKMFIEPHFDTPEYMVFSVITAITKEDGADFEDQEYFYDKKEKLFYQNSAKYPEWKKGRIFDADQYAHTIDITTLYKMEEEGSLNLQLKEILSKATEDDNPVLVVLTLHK